MISSFNRNIKFKSRLLSSLMRVKPDFFIVGAEKSGTSSAYWNFQAMPQVFSCFIKEANCFDRENFTASGLDWLRYRALFPLAPIAWFYTLRTGKKAFSFETSPGLFASRRGLTLLKRKFPKAKIVVFLRNPIERSYSSFVHGLKSGAYSGNFEDHVIKFGPKYAECGKNPLLFPENFGENAIRFSLYAPYVNFMIDLFGRRNCIFLKFEDFHNNFFATQEKLCEFLGLELNGGENYMPIISTSYLPINKDTVYQMNDLLEPFNQALVELLGAHFEWKAEDLSLPRTESGKQIFSIPAGNIPDSWKGDWVDLSAKGRVSDVRKLAR